MQVAALRNRFQQPGFAVSQHWSDFARHTVVQIRDIVDAMQVNLLEGWTLTSVLGSFAPERDVSGSILHSI